MLNLDTNVLVRFLVQDDPEQSRHANAIVAGRSQTDPAYLTVVVLLETYWVLTRAYAFSAKQVLAEFSNLLQCVDIEIAEPVAVSAAIKLSQRQGVDFADALIARLAGHCRDTVTFDQKAAKKLGWTLLGEAGK